MGLNERLCFFFLLTAWLFRFNKKNTYHVLDIPTLELFIHSIYPSILPSIYLPQTTKPSNPSHPGKPSRIAAPSKEKKNRGLDPILFLPRSSLKHTSYLHTHNRLAKMQENDVIAIIIIVLFVVLALIAFGIYRLVSMARASGSSRDGSSAESSIVDGDD